MHHLNEANDITEPWFCDFLLLLSKYYGTWWCAIFAKVEWMPILFNYLTILMNEIIHGGILLTYVFFSPFQQVLSVFTLYFVGLCYVWRWCLIQTRNINHNYIIRRFVRAIWLIMTFQLNVIQWVFRHHSVYWPESKVTTWMELCVYYFIIDIKSMICHKSNVNDQIVLHFI